MIQDATTAGGKALSSLVDWRYGTGIHRRDRNFVVRGVVEYNRDPEHRGRVMVRVLENGPEMKLGKNHEPRVATFDLGWCSPLFSQGAGMGFGSYNVPPVGARVFVLYERGARENPVYFGGWYANAARQRRYGVTKTTLEPPRVAEGESGFDEDGHAGGDFKYPPKPAPYGGEWTSEQRPELPLELVEMEDHTPDIQMFFKTLKGAALMVKERDEVEEFFLIDRLGAELRFESNTVLKDDGVLRRGMNSATQLEPMGLDNLISPAQKISLVTATQAGLEVESGQYGNDGIQIQSHPEDHSLERNTDLYETRMAVELDQGEQRLRVLFLDGGTIMGEITFDAVSRRIDLRGLDHIQLSTDSAIELEAPQIRIRGDLEVDGEIRQIGGDKLTFVDNDMEPYTSQMRNAWDIQPVDEWDGFRRDEDADRW